MSAPVCTICGWTEPYHVEGMATHQFTAPISGSTTPLREPERGPKCGYAIPIVSTSGVSAQDVPEIDVRYARIVGVDEETVSLALAYRDAVIAECLAPDGQGRTFWQREAALDALLKHIAQRRVSPSE